MFSSACLSHSGIILHFKIDCDVLTDADWDIMAELIGMRNEFNQVVGIPRGGIPLAERLADFAVPQTKKKKRILIVDDVLTTGRSMEEYYARYKTPETKVRGVVLFARSRAYLPSWVDPVFQLHGIYADGC